MVLVDTSVWIGFFRIGNRRLVKLLREGNVYCHELIIGELACGNLQNRSEILDRLQKLPHTMQVCHEEVLFFIESNRIMGRGLGYIDVSLLASSILTGVPLWTFDKALRQVSVDLGIGFDG